jgi:hypothetical protein
MSNSSSSSHQSPPSLSPKLATVIIIPHPDAAWVEVSPISITGVPPTKAEYVKIGLSDLKKSDTLIFPKTLDCAPDRSSHVGELGVAL